MMAILLAAALAQPAPPWEVRPEDTIGRQHRPEPPVPPILFLVRIDSPTANPRTEFRVRRWGRPGEAPAYYVEREISDGRDDSEHLLDSRRCPAFLPLLRALPDLRFAPLYVDGISPAWPLPESNRWRYLFGGTAMHPTGQSGEMVMVAYQVAGAEPDPFARWAQAFDRAYSACLRR